MSYIDQYLNEITDTLHRLPQDQIAQIIQILKQARTERRQIFLIGNGGSACTASHLGEDLGKLVHIDANGGKEACYDELMRWEYMRVDLDIQDVSKPTFVDTLNSLGAQGWELISTLQHERHGYSHEVHLVLKRALAESSTTRS